MLTSIVKNICNFLSTWIRFLQAFSLFVIATILAGCGLPFSASQSDDDLPVVDNIPPDISFAAPLDNERTTNLRPVFSINYSDNDVVNTNSLGVLIGDESIVQTCAINVTAAECTPDKDLPLGEVTVTASVSDMSGNESTVSITIFVEAPPDTTDPEISVTDPSDGSSTTNRRPDISVNFSDDVEIDISSFGAVLGGQDITTFCDVTINGASCSPGSDVPFGEVELIVNVSDIAGNSATDTISFTIEMEPDTTAPTISIVQPSAGVTLTNRRPLINVDFSDDRSIVRSSFSLIVDGQDLTSICTISDDNANCQPVSDLPLGALTITAAISDEAGNEATDVVSFTLANPPDLTSPVVAIESPVDGNSVENRRPEISISYSDNIALDISSFLLEIGGQDATNFCNVGSASAVCQSPSDIPLGNTEILATISDVSGNSAFDSITIDIQDPPDTVSPTISIDAPIDGSTIADLTPSILVSFEDDRAVDLASLRVTVAGEAISDNCIVNDRSAECPVSSDLNPGSIRIEASVSDEAGNSGSAVATITLELPPDTIAPTITIESPADGSTISDTTPTVSVSYDDERGLDLASLLVVVAGEDVSSNCTVTDRSAECETTTVLPREEFSIEASISDNAGNTSSSSATVTIGNLPTVMIGSPQSGLLTKVDSTSVSGTVSERAEIVTINGVNADLNGTAFSATVPLREGEQPLSRV